MMEFLFDGRSKMSDLLRSNAALIRLMPRFGIELGFGDRTVAAVCKLHGVDTNFFLLICKIYAIDGYVPTDDEVVTVGLEQLIDYLEASHKYYVEQRLPHIEQHLKLISDKLPENVAIVFNNFVAGYRKEVSRHFEKEEKKVYPYVGKLLRGEPTGNYSISTFLHHHSDVEEKLEDLTQILFKYLPGNANSDNTIDVLYDLLELEDDLRRHTLIEEKVMAPHVRKLEEER